MKKADFDIIIVNFKSTNYLLECLKSVYDSLDGLQANIFIHDNLSEDAHRIRKQFPEVSITENRFNIGFSAAINSEIKHGHSPYIILLNPDSNVFPGFFKTVMQFMKNNPDVGICGPRILNKNMSVQGSARRFPTLLTGFFGRNSLLTRWFPNNWITKKTILTNGVKGRNPINVDWVSGACMVIRREAVEDVGPMDERFFMYWEDVDWCKRMWEKDWKVVYLPFAEIVHYVGGSSNKRPVKSLLEFHRSCYLYFIKHNQSPLFILKPFAFSGLSIRFFFSALIIILNGLFSNKKTTGKQKEKATKILFLITEDWYFWSHRLPLARAAKKAGFEVVIATRVHKHQRLIENEGFKLIPLNISRRSKNPYKEYLSLLNIFKIYKKERPDIVHHVAMKPVLYGSWIAQILSVPAIINAIAGLGFVFLAKGKKSILIRKMVALAYRSSFSRGKTIGIFQNPQDVNFFINSKILKTDKAVLIRGSGVDINKFAFIPEKNNGVPIVVLASRMLWDKGVGDFVKAAEILKRSGVNCRFILVGDPDPENPMTIPDNVLNKWNQSGTIEWWGHRDDIPEIFSQSNIIALPSYREGLPKVLLEAASCGRALLATDVPGCREIVRHNENGLLVPPYSPKKIADALNILIHDEQLRRKMGETGRRIVENEFSEEIVANETMALYQSFALSTKK